MSKVENEVKNDLTKKFSKTTRIIHWLTAILVLVLFLLGDFMDDTDLNLVKTHAILGLVVLILTAIRAILFFKSEKPADLKTGSKLNDKLIVWIHYAFYFILLGVSLSGIASMIVGGYIEILQMSASDFESVKDTIDIPDLDIHETFVTALMILIGIHVVGFIKHLVLKKENALKRII